jgi:hypothetical protein
MIPLCDTGKGDKVVSAEQHLSEALNELRKIGGDECTAELESEDDLKQLLDQLIQAAPQFKFGTNTPDPTAEYPEPRTFERWYGSKGLENGEAPEPGAGVTASGDAEGGGKTEASDPNAEIMDLGAAADDGDNPDRDDAQTKLEELAKEAGVPEKVVKGADSWVDVAKMILEKTAGGGEETETETAADAPANTGPVKGKVYYFKPIGKDKKPGKKVECEVIAVDEKANTVDLKNLDDKKVIYRKVSFDKLLEE